MNTPHRFKRQSICRQRWEFSMFPIPFWDNSELMQNNQSAASRVTSFAAFLTESSRGIRNK